MWFLFTLGNVFCWAWVNVLDSMLVKRYEKNPVLLMWSQSIFSVPALLLLSFFLDISSPLALWLWGAGLLAYIGDLAFFWVLDRIDVSVVNGGWAILSVYLSIAGFLLFGESWTALQWGGAVLVLAGVMVLSFWNQHISFTRTLLILAGLALLHTPYYVAKKAAVDHGIPLHHVFFWMVLGRETLAFCFPWLVPKLRTGIKSLVKRIDRSYFAWSGIVIVCFFGAEFLGTLSYSYGQVSLISVVSNIQPFVVLAMAWVLWKITPRLAAREVLSAQSIGIKVISFCIVFLGLALLVLSL